MHLVVALLCKLIPTPGRYSGWDLIDLMQLLWEVIPYDVFHATRERGPQTVLIRDEVYAVAVRRFFREYPECNDHRQSLYIRALCGDETVIPDCLREALGQMDEVERFKGTVDALSALGTAESISALRTIYASSTVHSVRRRAAIQLVHYRDYSGHEILRQTFQEHTDFFRAVFAVFVAAGGDRDACDYLETLSENSASLDYESARAAVFCIYPPESGEELVTQEEFLKWVRSRRGSLAMKT